MGVSWLWGGAWFAVWYDLTLVEVCDVLSYPAADAWLVVVIGLALSTCNYLIYLDFVDSRVGRDDVGRPRGD